MKKRLENWSLWWLSWQRNWSYLRKLLMIWTTWMMIKVGKSSRTPRKSSRWELKWIAIRRRFSRWSRLSLIWGSKSLRGLFMSRLRLLSSWLSGSLRLIRRPGTFKLWILRLFKRRRLKWILWPDNCKKRHLNAMPPSLNLNAMRKCSKLVSSALTKFTISNLICTRLSTIVYNKSSSVRVNLMKNKKRMIRIIRKVIMRIMGKRKKRR